MFVVKTQRLAGYLMQKGFVLQRIDQDYKDPKRNVFLFNRSDELNNAVKEYKIKKEA